jgi:hypothetical protein
MSASLFRSLILSVTRRANAGCVRLQRRRDGCDLRGVCRESASRARQHPPAVTGATGKTVRGPRCAKRARVTYTITARDEVDGVVPVSCRLKSVSFFKMGRTLVRCSATDTSANARTATFTVTVKAAGRRSVTG